MLQRRASQIAAKEVPLIGAVKKSHLHEVVL